jgi:hypothetical protein
MVRIPLSPPEFFARGLSRVSASPRQRPDANPPWLDHDQIAHELVRVGGNDFGCGVSLCCVREAIQFQQDHAANIQALTNDQFAEIAILREKNAVFSIRRLKNIPVRRRLRRAIDHRNEI